MTGEGEYNLNVLKDITVTDDYLEMDEAWRESYYETHPDSDSHDAAGAQWSRWSAAGVMCCGAWLTQ